MDQRQNFYPRQNFTDLRNPRDPRDAQAHATHII